MARKKARKPKGPTNETFLETYKRIRKPMPPPERVAYDRRRKHQDDEARREIEEGREGLRSPDGR